MKLRLKILFLIFSSFTAAQLFAQDVNRTISPENDPEKMKIIPDKVFEIGLPLLFLFLIANITVSVFKIKAENRLKEKALDKGLSEATLVSLFSEEKILNRYVYVKWFLVLMALGIALLIIHFFSSYFRTQSGYLALGVIVLLQSFAFIIYFLLLRKKK